MTGIVYEHSVLNFLILTCLIGGGAAFQTGRSVSQMWQPAWYLIVYCALLAVTARFLYYAVFQQTLLSLHYFAVDYGVLLAAGLIGWRLKRTKQMTVQYSWLYERTGFFKWRQKKSEYTQ